MTPQDVIDLINAISWSNARNAIKGATVKGILTAIMGLVTSLWNRPSGGGLSFVASVTALATLNVPFGYLAGYNTAGDPGAGPVFYDSTSTVTDGGMSLPGNGGRYVRPFAGFCQFDHYGVDKTNRTIAGGKVACPAKFQAWVNFVLVNYAEGHGGGGIVELSDNADPTQSTTVTYFNIGGTAQGTHVQNGVSFYGAGPSGLLIRNSLFCMGVPGAQGGDGNTLAPILIEGWEHDGGEDWWSPEGTPVLRRYRAVGIPTNLAMHTGGAIVNWYCANHGKQENYRIENGRLPLDGSSNDNGLIGIRYTLCSQHGWDSGAVSTNRVGILFDWLPVSPRYATVTNLVTQARAASSSMGFYNLHGEGGTQEYLLINNCANLMMQNCQIRGGASGAYAWDLTHPLISFGLPTGPSFTLCLNNNELFGKVPPVGGTGPTCVNIVSGQYLFFINNYITVFNIGIDCSHPPADYPYMWANKFTNIVANPTGIDVLYPNYPRLSETYIVPAQNAINFEPGAIREYKPISTVFSWNMAIVQQATAQLKQIAGGRPFPKPLNPIEGPLFYCEWQKVDASAFISTWDSSILWENNTPPPFTGLSTTAIVGTWFKYNRVRDQFMAHWKVYGA